MRFRAADVFLPATGPPFGVVSGEDEYEGTVVAFSDSGKQERVFAVVEVVQIQSIVVPVEKLEMIKPPERSIL